MQRWQTKNGLTNSPSTRAFPALNHHLPSRALALGFKPTISVLTTLIMAAILFPSRDRGWGACGRVASRAVVGAEEAKQAAESTLKSRSCFERKSQNASSALGSGRA